MNSPHSIDSLISEVKRKMNVKLKTKIILNISLINICIGQEAKKHMFAAI